MSFSLKVSCDSYGFRNGLRWVPHAGQKVEFELSPKPCAKTGMGSVWVPNGFRFMSRAKIAFSLKPRAETSMGSGWVPSGFRIMPCVEMKPSPMPRAKTSMGSVWVPNAWRQAGTWVVKIELAPMGSAEIRMGSERFQKGSARRQAGCVVKIELAPGFLRFIWVP